MPAPAMSGPTLMSNSPSDIRMANVKMATVAALRMMAPIVFARCLACSVAIANSAAFCRARRS